MIIPKGLKEREEFFLDLIQKCMVSRESRRADYQSLRSYYLFGAGPEEAPAHYNKIYSHIDQLTSFLYSSETTRFSIDLGASVNPDFWGRYVPTLTKKLNDEWNNSNTDQVFSTCLSWAMTFSSTFLKIIPFRGTITPYMVDPGNMGVLREDIPYTDRQEAICQVYYITKSELYARLYSHPKRSQFVERVQSSQHEPSDVPNGVDRIIMSQTNPQVLGNVNLDLYGFNRLKAQVAEDTVEMIELYVWDDEAQDYQVITRAEPDVIIYDRPNEKMFLKGELPFVQICPLPQYDYYWGQSEVQKLIYLQQMRNTRMGEILDLLAKNVSPPTALMGFTGILDEKNFALNRAGGLLSTDMPNAKADRLAPPIPQDLYEQLHQIDAMMEEASGISNVLAGRGEQGVRSAGHASQLARLGSSRAKKRALVIEDALEKVATLYMKLIQAYDDTALLDTEGQKFIAEQFTKDFVVKVDAHSNSPIFMEDLRSLAFNLFKAQAIDKESLIDLLEPPMKQLIKERLKKMPQAQPGGGNVTPMPKKAQGNG
jgi:hypothetical protein